MILLLIFVLSGVSCYQNIRCPDPTQVSCDNGECIFRFLWCDGVKDCSDESDERMCDGEDSTQFGIRAPNGKHLPKVGQDTVEAVKKAVKYIVGQVTDDGWGTFTPRAAVALSFAGTVSALTPDEEKLMMKHLEIHLMRDLLERTVHRTELSLTSLASYINALYATCQDPRDFQGYDLVALLRWKVDSVSSNFSYPYVLMSLCLADLIKGKDANTLAEMYDKNSKPGFRALVITAMTCIGHKDEDILRKIKKLYMEPFFNDSREAADKMDIYNKALYLQAAIASNFSTPSDIARYQLENYQLPDGSFGGMLATYSIIPVLLYSSLLDLRCKLPEKKALITGKQFKQIKEHELVYSLWITSEQGTDTHSMDIPFSEDATFLDVMRIASFRNPLYKFLYEETPAGKKVYSLAGIPNDIETAKKWTLYKGHPDVKIDHLQYLNGITQGVDKIFPKDKDHFIFLFSPKTIF